MKKIFIIFILCFVSISAAAGEPTVIDRSGVPGVQNQQEPQPGSSAAEPKTSTLDDTCKKTTSPFSTYKINYFSFYRWPGGEQSQVKFQFSAKYKVLNRDVKLWGVKSAAYVAYSQKSFWSIGKPSKPFEESNYNPEVFFDFSPDLGIGRLKLNDIIISPYEHESNGRDTLASRSWDRRYLEIRVGLEPSTAYETIDGFTPDIVELDVKAWHASGYYDQEDYLRSIGSNEHFLDFAGKGEVRLKIRNIIPWPFQNQLDLTTRIFHKSGKNNWSAEFQQHIPTTSFSLYLQYWRGFNESLLRFDRFEKNFYAGLSFCY